LVSVVNNLVQLASRLSCELVEAKFVRDEQSLEVIPETQTNINKIMKWHLFKGGLKIPELENNQTDVDHVLQQGL
jgi:hypothetical protein